MSGMTRKHFQLFASSVRQLLEAHPEFTEQQQQDIIAAVRHSCIACYTGSYGFAADRFNEACQPKKEKTAHE